MNTNASTPAPAGSFELRFPSLFDQGRGLAFPCDEQGRVDIGHLSEHALSNYLGARNRVGRDFATPRLLRAALPL